MKRYTTLLLAVAALLTLCFSVSADSNPFSVVRKPTANTHSSTALKSAAGRDTYTGTVRTYIVEPVSRWRDSEGKNYNFGFLDWGPGGDVNIPDGTRWEQSMTWNSVSAGWGSISSSNIQATTAVFDSASVLTDAYPPYGYYFMAHYCDASAAATPGHPGSNATPSGYTHTVFIEEGTATW